MSVWFLSVMYNVCVCVQYCSDAECEGGSRGGDKGTV